MKIEKVTYQKTYSIGPYLTDRVGFEASTGNDWVKIDGVNVWETPEIALSNLEKIADEWHRKAHPHIYQDNSQLGTDNFKYTPTENIIPGQLPIISKDHEKMEIAIDNCATIEDLKAWKEANPVFPHKILVHYNERFKSLSLNKEEDHETIR